MENICNCGNYSPCIKKGECRFCFGVKKEDEN